MDLVSGDGLPLYSVPCYCKVNIESIKWNVNEVQVCDILALSPKPLNTQVLSAKMRRPFILKNKNFSSPLVYVIDNKTSAQALKIYDG